MGNPLVNLPSSDPEAIRENFRFHEFIRTIIQPNEPDGFKHLSEFHNFLIFTATLPRSATAAPRGSLKSTILAKYRALHRLVDPLSRPNLSAPTEVAIVSETEKLSQDHLFWIKTQLKENRYLIQKYGDLTNDELTWNESDIRLTNGRRCMALGYGSQIRGRHPSDIIVDDLESLKNMGTEDTLLKLKDWFFRVLYFASIPETHITVIGTIITPNSLLSELLTSPEWIGRTWEALQDDDTKSIWPERWSVEALIKERASVGIHRFNAEKQNRPLSSADPIIFEEWIRRHTEETLSTLQGVKIYIAVDPAFTTERWGCNSGIVVMKEASNGMLYEQLAWKRKVTGPDLIRTIMDFYYHFQREGLPIRLGVEEVQAQKMIRQSINELNPDIEVIPMKPDKDKARRLIDVSRYFEMGIVSLKTPSLIEEVLSFPHGEKDRVDSLVWTLKLYEMEHPIILNSQYEEIDHLKNMDDDTRQWFMERAEAGLPGYQPPASWIRQYNQAQLISALVDEGF